MLFPLETDLGEEKGKCYLVINSGQAQIENEDRKGAPPKEFNVIILHHLRDLCVLHFEFKSLEKNL